MASQKTKDFQLVDIGLDGSKLYYRFNVETGKDEWYTEGNSEHLLNMTQKAKNAESGNWKGDMHHFASIDPVTWQNWWNEFGGNPMSPENKPRLFRKLNSREYSKFRVKSGRV